MTTFTPEMIKKDLFHTRRRRRGHHRGQVRPAIQASSSLNASRKSGSGSRAIKDETARAEDEEEEVVVTTAVSTAARTAAMDEEEERDELLVMWRRTTAVVVVVVVVVVVAPSGVFCTCLGFLEKIRRREGRRAMLVLMPWWSLFLMRRA